jgi:hypothetical protein
MLGRVVVSGALGGLALMVWMSVANIVFGFSNRVEMKRIPEERAVHALLRQSIPAPGIYLAHPALTPEGRFPDNEPVYGIHASGFGHEAAGRLVFVAPALAFLSALLVAWLLSRSSSPVLARYANRAAFIVVAGLVVAVGADLERFGIGGAPAATAIQLAMNRVGAWLLAALVMAWTLRAPTAEDRGLRPSACPR